MVNFPLQSAVNFSYKYDVGGPVTKQWHTKRHKGSCRGLEFSPDGTSLVSVGKDAVIKIADAETGKVIAKDTEAHMYEFC
jgi:WD40 repeat protein